MQSMRAISMRPACNQWPSACNQWPSAYKSAYKSACNQWPSHLRESSRRALEAAKAPEPSDEVRVGGLACGRHVRVRDGGQPFRERRQAR